VVATEEIKGVTLVQRRDQLDPADRRHLMKENPDAGQPDRSGVDRNGATPALLR